MRTSNACFPPSELNLEAAEESLSPPPSLVASTENMRVDKAGSHTPSSGRPPSVILRALMTPRNTCLALPGFLPPPRGPPGGAAGCPAADGGLGRGCCPLPSPAKHRPQTWQGGAGGEETDDGLGGGGGGGGGGPGRSAGGWPKGLPTAQSCDRSQRTASSSHISTCCRRLGPSSFCAVLAPPPPPSPSVGGAGRGVIVAAIAWVARGKTTNFFFLPRGVYVFLAVEPRAGRSAAAARLRTCWLFSCFILQQAVSYRFGWCSCSCCGEEDEEGGEEEKALPQGSLGRHVVFLLPARLLPVGVAGRGRGTLAGRERKHGGGRR